MSESVTSSANEHPSLATLAAINNQASASPNGAGNSATTAINGGDESVQFRKEGTNFAYPNTELALLSACINRPKVLRLVCDTLSTEHFHDPHNNILIRAVLYLENAGVPVNPATVIGHLKATLEHFNEEWIAHVNQCAAASYNPKHIRGYIRQLQRAARLRGGDTYCEHTYSESFCASLLQMRLPPCKCVRGDWFEYGNGAWTKTAKDIYRTLALAVIHPYQRQAKRITDVLNHVESALQVSESIFSGAYKRPDGRILINVNNGTLEVDPLGKLTFRQHDPADYFTLKLAADYDPNARCELFDNTLTYALPDEEDRRLYQVFAGSVLMPSCEHEAALVCYGPGETGKSTLAETIGAVLGKELCGSCGLEELCKSGSYSLPTLKRKMLNLGSELEGTEIETSANFKKLVSGEQFSAREIYGRPEEMQTHCKLLFLTNHLPRFRGGTNAEERRLRILHFDREVVQKDPQLKSKLKAETSGVLNWMLEGLAWLLQNNYVPYGGDKAHELFAEFQQSNDPVRAFLVDCCQFDNSSSIAKHELFAAFKEWCEARGRKADKLENMFYKGLHQRYQVKTTRRKIVNKGREYWFEGVRLRD